MKSELIKLKQDKVEREKEMIETKKEMGEMKKALERNQSVLSTLITTGNVNVGESEEMYYNGNYDY